MAALTVSRVVKVLPSDSAVSSAACKHIIQIANKAIEERGKFVLAVSGGSVAKYMANDLPKENTDWSKWRMYFCDERHVPFDDPECTYTIYKNGLMSKVPLAEENVFPDNFNVSVEDAAKEYETKLRAEFPGSAFPEFDLLLLGMGPDGHTCSLFPGHPLLEEKTKWVTSISDSPKPPPQRITLTYPSINNAKAAMYISCGSGKAETVQRVLEGKEEPPLPAARVKLTHGELFWYLDEGAASLLKETPH